mgnify:CR=1 FL=1|tara:strand:- start:395 stop:988 length:594 start_codon:yes stop_codon:yes gene_type:complete
MISNTQQLPEVWTISAENDAWSNHPGFIGSFGQWVADAIQPGKAKERRYQKKLTDIKGECPYDTGDSCAELDDAYWCYQDIKDDSSGGFRTEVRARRAAESRMASIQNLMDGRDCEGRTSAIDSSQERETEAVQELKAEKEAFQAEMALIKEQTQLQMMVMQKQQADSAADYDKSKTNIMLAAGGAVALTLLIVMIK